MITESINSNSSTIFCYYHPTVETGLRCKRCEKPICSKCAISTPTGYICKQCEHSQQKIFDTAITTDYFVAFIISALISGIGSLIVNKLGFFVILLAPIVGVIIAEVVRAGVRKRRSNTLFKVALLGSIVGGIPALLFVLLLANLWSILIISVYLVLVSITLYQRLKGISLG
jgi:hypothetical protein